MSVALSKMNKKQLYEECKRLLQDNMTLQLFQDDMCEKVLDRGAHIDILDKEIEKLKEENQDFKREKLMLHNVCNEYKKENNKLTEEVLERDTHIDILDKEVEETNEQLMILNDMVEDLKEQLENSEDNVLDLKEENEKMKENYGKLQLEDFNNRINILFAKV